MGFWDVLLFCIASVLGPRWIAAAARNGQSSISIWILAAILFFVPTAFIVVELSTRFPEEGGLYVWTKMAFGDFHGFVAGWTYWTYTIFYFPGFLMASAAMTAYVGGCRTAWLAENQTFLLVGSFVLLTVAVWLNIIGLHIGKWLQNAGGIGTYVPLLMIVGVALLLWSRQGSVTHFTRAAMLPHWNWDTVNFWSQIAFAFSGLELVSALSEEVRDPQRTFPKAIFASGGLIAADLHRGDHRHPDDDSRGRRGSEKRSLSGHYDRIDGPANWNRGSDRGAARDRGKCRRGRNDRGGDFARAFCCRD